MATIRVICHESDGADAMNIGGPVHVHRKTFDVPATPELIAWMNDKGNKWSTRAIDGVEIVE